MSVADISEINAVDGKIGVVTIPPKNLINGIKPNHATIEPASISIDVFVPIIKASRAAEFVAAGPGYHIDDSTTDTAIFSWQTTRLDRQFFHDIHAKTSGLGTGHRISYVDPINIVSIVSFAASMNDTRANPRSHIEKCPEIASSWQVL